LLATTAFGMTETLSGFKLALRVVFSLLHGVSWGSIYSVLLVYTPSMRNTNNMVDVAQREFKQLVRHDTRSIAEAKQRVIGEDGPQTHRTCM
jgi:hypothetical protein